MRSATRSRSSCLTLPSTRTSRMPGDGRGHHVDHPRGHQPPGDPLEAVVGQVLEQGVVGGDATAPDAATRGPSASEAGLARSRGAPGRRRRRRARPALELDHQDREAGLGGHAGQTAAATVVLPTPPLPATTSTRLSVQKAATSIRRQRSPPPVRPPAAPVPEVPGKTPCLGSATRATLAARGGMLGWRCGRVMNPGRRRRRAVVLRRRCSSRRRTRNARTRRRHERRGPRASAPSATSARTASSYAIRIREPHGIWGGLNETERKLILERRAG